MTPANKSFFFSLSMSVLKLIRAILLTIALLVLIFFLIKFIGDIHQYPILAKFESIVSNLIKPVLEKIKLTIPYKYNNVDYSPLIFIVLLLIVNHLCTLMIEKLAIYKQRNKSRMDYNEWRSHVSSTVSKEKLQEIDSKFEELSTVTKGSERKRMLAEFVKLKSQLDSMGQQLAFLAVDVVDSTGMKRNEDKYISAYDFDQYNELVNECLYENGVVKYSMTPDGIMSCFRTVDDAVNTAKMLIERLVQFNAEHKNLKADFNVRCGINAGFVYMDDETPLEQISDRVIDIAGHMQKHAKPNSINIAASAIEPLKGREGFQETTDIIDEQQVFQLHFRAEDQEKK